MTAAHKTGRILYWPSPPDLQPEKAANLERGWSAITNYEVAHVVDGGESRFEFRKKADTEDYFREVPLGPSLPHRRWLPLQAALSESKMYVPGHHDAGKSLAAAQRMSALNPRKTNQQFHKWLDAAEEAFMQSPAEQIGATGEWIENEFETHFGGVEPIALTQSFQAFGTHQMVEMLAKFSVMPSVRLAEYLGRSDVQELMAEGAHSHSTSNHFVIPLAISFPEWLGQSMRTVSSAALFIVQDVFEPAFLDAHHRDIWNGWIGAWYADADEEWEILRPARRAPFVRWYLTRLNALLAQLGDPATTASANGEIRPLKQVALIRSVLALESVVGRCLITSDSYSRSMLAMMALSRFDDLGWGFREITDGKFMTALMAPLEQAEEVGGMYSVYGLRVWKQVMGDIIKGAAGTWDEATGRIHLLDGTSPPATAYAGNYLTAVRNTIHRFHPDAMQERFGLHSGTLPISLSQLAVLLWLRALVDPSQLIRQFRT